MFSEYGIVTSPHIERALRAVDRLHFVPRGKESLASAHLDEPLREGNIHISAPHMYGAILESLELDANNSPISFLNLGSGTGYLSVIVAYILGTKSNGLQFGVDIHADVIEHAMASVARWKNSIMKEEVTHNYYCKNLNISFSIGNALHVDSNKGEGRFGFDRIYVGTACEEENLPHFMSMLAPGGILVCPCEDELVKVTRRKDDDVFLYEILGCVHFSLMMEEPRLKVSIRSRVWSPALNPAFPSKFQECLQTLLLCASSNYYQGNGDSNRNLALMIPSDLWKIIFTYMNRNWFVAERQNDYISKKRPQEEEDFNDLSNGSYKISRLSESLEDTTILPNLLSITFMETEENLNNVQQTDQTTNSRMNAQENGDITEAIQNIDVSDSNLTYERLLISNARKVSLGE